MWDLPLAMLGSSALGAGSSIFGALTQKSATSKATDFAKQMFNEVVNFNRPFWQAGSEAAGTLSNLLRPGADMSSILQNIPGFKFLQDITQRGVANQGTVTGLGGNTLLAGANAGNNIALSAGWQPIVNSLQGLINTGAGAAGAISDAATGVGKTVGSNIIGGANAIAGGAVGAGNSISNALTTNALLNALTKGGGMYNAQNDSFLKNLTADGK